jgi:hypothetical protein
VFGATPRAEPVLTQCTGVCVILNDNWHAELVVQPVGEWKIIPGRQRVWVVYAACEAINWTGASDTNAHEIAILSLVARSLNEIHYAARAGLWSLGWQGRSASPGQYISLWGYNCNNNIGAANIDAYNSLVTRDVVHIGIAPPDYIVQSLTC